MTTPWDRMTDDDAYKNWLLEDMTVEDFNGQTPLQRKQLRALFQQHQEQQQQLNEAQKNPYKTPNHGPKHSAQPPGSHLGLDNENYQQKKKMSPTLRSTLKKLKEKEVILAELPADCEHAAWDEIEKQTNLSALELSAV